MSALIGYIGVETRDLWLDTALGTVGAVGLQVLVDEEKMAVVSGLGTTYLTVERGAAGTTKVAHAIGAAVTIVAPAELPADVEAQDIADVLVALGLATQAEA